MEGKGQMRENLMVVSITIMVCVLFRWALSLGPYSGKGKAPMFGDFEAQRHWMEITYNLPIKEWYVNSSRNNLEYWGLDYPPLTAYHSWLMGFVAKKINSSWVDLDVSRGLESYEHKLFMRYTVLVADLLLFLPATLVFVFHFQRSTGSIFSKCTFVATHLLYPGLMLIDHGHFQYNCVSLGLFLWAVMLILAGKNLIGSFLFVLALSYKQMELYHALPFFCYLLGSTFKKNTFLRGVIKLAGLSGTVVGSFVAIWWPFLQSYKLALQVIHRLFPFARGIYEDKVANFWCSSSVFVKWRNIFDRQDMVNICAITTLIVALPSSVMLLWRPSKYQFKLALLNSSLAFFMFSFQVHEKSILLVALPSLLILNDEPVNVAWFLMISVISLYPLMIKDELTMSFYALTIFYYCWLCDIFQLDNFIETTKKNGKKKLRYNMFFFHASVMFGILLCMMSHVIKPPKKLPDLYSLLISIFCCAHFLLFLCYFNWKQFSCFKSLGIEKIKKV